MGNSRLLVEHALREIQTLVHRARVSEGTQREIRSRFLKLLAELRVHDETAASGPTVPTRLVCESILSDIVSDVLDKHVPKREATRWEIEALRGDDERIALRRRVTELEAEINALQAQVTRRDAAHHYVMQSYFREVWALRKDRASIAHERDVSLHQQALLSLQQQQQVLQQQPPLSDLTPAIAPSPSMAMGGRPQSSGPAGGGRLPTLRSGSAGSRMHGEGAAASRPPSAGRGLERVGSQSGMSVASSVAPSHIPRPPTDNRAQPQTTGQPSPAMASLGHLGGSPVPLPPPGPPNTEAIFDYEKYLQLFSDSSADVTQRYMKLLADFEDFQKRAHAEREATLAHMQAEVDLRDRKIELLTRSQERSGDLMQGTHAQIAAERARLAEDREAIGKQLAAFHLYMRTQSLSIYDTLDEVRAQSRLVGDYVKAASEMIASIVSPHATPSEEAAARDAFQSVLAPNPADNDCEKRAKLYWRRHDATNATLAAVVAVRKALAMSKVLQGRMATLSDYALKESAEGLRKAKALNDLRFDKKQDDLTLAALAESTRYSADPEFLARLFEAGGDAEFEMNDVDRDAIVTGSARRRDLARKRVAAVCRRVRHRVVMTNVKYTFELKAGAATDEHAGLEGSLAVQEHLQTLVDLRRGRIDALLEETTALGSEMLHCATDLVASLPAELLYRVRNWIRKRADALLDCETDSAASSVGPAPRRGSVTNALTNNDSFGKQRRDPKTATSPRTGKVPARPEAPARYRSSLSASGNAGNPGGASEAEINALRDQVAALSAALAELQAELARMRRQRDEDENETIGMRITALEPPVPTGRYLPTMGGIGVPAVQDQSLQVLAKTDDIGSTHRSPVRKRPGTSSGSSLAAPGSARRSATRGRR